MTDSSDPDENPLPATKATWCERFYGIATWSWDSAWSTASYVTGSSSEPEAEARAPPPPNPAEQMLATLRDPRPEALSPPDTAANKDTSQKSTRCWRRLGLRATKSC